jgi:hypothetical protein
MKLRHVTLRDLFWLILVVALATGWVVDRRALDTARRNEAAERQRAEAAARAAEYGAAVAASTSARNAEQIGRILESPAGGDSPGE